MRPLVEEVESAHSAQTLAALLRNEPGLVLFHSGTADPSQGRYSFVAAQPFLTFESRGTASLTHRLSHLDGPATCESHNHFGNPWNILDSLMQRFELLDEVDLPFPLGGCFGYWGYDLKNFVEPHLRQSAINDLDLPDCWVGFYDSLVAFDHALNKTWVISTGVDADGSRSEAKARCKAEFWRKALERPSSCSEPAALPIPAISSNLSRDEFIEKVIRAQSYIRNGDIYQVNLAQRLSAACPVEPFDLYERLSALSPAPFSAFLNSGDFQIVSSSPERFLRMSGSFIQTRPIKGTRPRSGDPTRDAQLAYELQTSPKEIAELVMITDLLRNDLGRVCEFGSIQVPELVRLERFAQVQHLVSTVEGQLRSGVTHLEALARCFPGGSVTGAPKIRAMEIIDELEPVTRGPYTGCFGYIGFNRESQLSILIRTAACKGGSAWFHVGAGIVADSDPAAEYDETWAKAAGFVAALQPTHDQRCPVSNSRAWTRATSPM